MSEEKKRPQDKWNEKNNYIAKSFKMRKELADEFRDACDMAGVSQSGQIVKAFLVKCRLLLKSGSSLV